MNTLRNYGLGALSALSLGLALLGSGCSDDPKSSSPPACSEGEEDCACVDGTTCNGGLACDRGFCVPGDACPAGTEDCACLDDGTCNAAGGNLVCENAKCVASETPDEGTVGGPCYANGSCNDGLECQNNICASPGCETGATGCACGPGGVCTDAAASCSTENVCTLAGCTPGEENCACDSGTCGAGLACEDDLCRAAGGFGLSVGNPDVRSCDVLITENGGTISHVAFDAQAMGKFLRRDPKVALAFFVRGDQAFAGTVARITTASEANTANFSVAATCKDAQGQVVDDAQVTLGGE